MPEPDRQKRGRPRSDEARRAILDAAYALVLERGYEAVTTAEMAARAGAGKQTIYRWWRSKAELVLDALEEWAEDRIDADPVRPLRSFLVRVCEGASAAGPVLRSLMAQAQFDDELREKLKLRLISRRRAALDGALAASGIADDRQRQTLIRAIYGALWYRLLLDEPLDARFVEDMVALAARFAGHEPV